MIQCACSEVEHRASESVLAAPCAPHLWSEVHELGIVSPPILMMPMSTRDLYREHQLFVLAALPLEEVWCDGTMEGHAKWLTELWCTDTRTRVLFTLRAMNMDRATFQTSLDDEAAAAITADLFRPGWTDSIVQQTAPGIQGAFVFRAFMLERLTSFVAFPHVQWNLMGVVPTPLDVPFVWTDIVRDLDRWHAWIFRHIRPFSGRSTVDDRA